MLINVLINLRKRGTWETWRSFIWNRQHNKAQVKERKWKEWHKYINNVYKVQKWNREERKKRERSPGQSDERSPGQGDERSRSSLGTAGRGWGRSPRCSPLRSWSIHFLPFSEKHVMLRHPKTSAFVWTSHRDLWPGKNWGCWRTWSWSWTVCRLRHERLWTAERREVWPELKDSAA